MPDLQFLHPGAGLLAAAIAGPVLLVLYLLRLRRRPARVSSILFWPVAVRDVQVNEPLRRVRPSWLLALHALMCGVICLALARPVWSGGSAASRLVLIVDTSASMDAADTPGGPARLARAKDRATALAREALGMGSGREVAIISLAADASLIGPFTSSFNAAAGAIASLTQTDQPGNLGAALRLAQTVAADRGSDESAAPVAAALISDGAFAPDESPDRIGIPVRFEMIGDPVAPPDNVGIVAFTARRDDRDPTTVRFFAEILSTRGGATTVALAKDGTILDRRIVSIQPPLAGTQSRGALNFEQPDSTGGVWTLLIEKDDALPSDNRASLVTPAPASRRFGLVRGEDLSPVSLLLGDALTELRPRELITLSPDEYARRSPRELEDLDLIIFDGVRAPSPPTRPSISFGWPPPFVGLSVASAPTTLSEGSPLFWDRSSPVLRNAPLDSLVVARVTTMSFPRGVESGNTGYSELLTGPAGPMMILIESGGVRHIATNFVLRQSNWPLLASFPIFLSDAADYLTLGTAPSSGRFFRTDEPATVRIRATQTPGVLNLTGPDGATREVRVPADTAETGLGVLPRSGVYLLDGPRASERAVAVNLNNATESALDTYREVMVGRTAFPGIRSGRAFTELWPFLLMTLMALLIIEWAVYAHRART
ncbi:MAG: VWA domain-containing protein [Phycisphaerae bacterium]|nr:VWA domain-containing protein [Phycisphaerae bacterium]